MNSVLSKLLLLAYEIYIFYCIIDILYVVSVTYVLIVNVCFK